MKIGSQRLREIIREEVEAEVDALKGFGTKTATQSAQARSGMERSKSIAKEIASTALRTKKEQCSCKLKRR